MRVIAIETSGAIGSVAVCEGGLCLEEKSFEKGMQHGQALLSSIEEIFKDLGWKAGDADLIAVSHGPGSFTGLRIGITCAKTIAYVLGKPLVAVPTLDVLAENIKPGDAPICPVLDAKRKAVYACIYEPVNGIWQRQAVKPPGGGKAAEFLAIEPQSLITLLPRPILVFGDGILPYLELFKEESIIIGDHQLGIARARVVAQLGIQQYEKGTIYEPFKLQPLYMRRPEAEEKWEAIKG